MLKFLQFGIIKENGCAINHRTLRKIFLNPILRMFGFEIGSIFDGNTFEKFEIFPCKKQLNIFKNYYQSIFYK
jgi:hypothetical protein